MERRKTGELKAGVTSDAESTVSTRSSSSSTTNSSRTLWKQKQRRLKTERLSSRDNGKQEHQEQVEEKDQFKSLEVRVGAILETTEAQVAMILLIALDIGCTAVEIHLHDQQQLLQLNSRADVATSLLVRIVTRLVESFTGFTLFFFLIELAVLLAAFRHKFFAHAGYVLDLTVVSLSLAVELYSQTKVPRLLGILRIWRVLRLVRRLVDQERVAHDTTRLLLEQEQLKLLHVRMQKDAAHESLKREYESRAGLEQLLRGYKDEIVTLKEALQIAAQAVAEVTMNESEQRLYEYSESAVAEGSIGSYPLMADSAYVEEEYYQEVGAVHPTQVQSDLETRDRQESEYHHQEAVAVHPTETQEMEEEQLQEEHQTVAVSPTEVQTGLEAEHCQESENEFEDAVDE